MSVRCTVVRSSVFGLLAAACGSGGGSDAPPLSADGGTDGGGSVIAAGAPQLVGAASAKASGLIKETPLEVVPASDFGYNPVQRYTTARHYFEVMFDADVTVGEVNAALVHVTGSIVGAYAAPVFLQIKLPDAATYDDLEAAVAAAGASAHVSAVTRDQPIGLKLNPLPQTTAGVPYTKGHVPIAWKWDAKDAPGYRTQEGGKTEWLGNWGLISIGAQSAWNYYPKEPTATPGVALLAIIDGGFEQHSDLTGLVPPPGDDWGQELPGLDPDAAHGTHCVGTMGADWNTKFGEGINKYAKIYSYRIKNAAVNSYDAIKDLPTGVVAVNFSAGNPDIGSICEVDAAKVEVHRCDLSKSVTHATHPDFDDACASNQQAEIATDAKVFESVLDVSPAHPLFVVAGGNDSSTKAPDVATYDPDSKAHLYSNAADTARFCMHPFASTGGGSQPVRISGQNPLNGDAYTSFTVAFRKHPGGTTFDYQVTSQSGSDPTEPARTEVAWTSASTLPGGSVKFLDSTKKKLLTLSMDSTATLKAGASYTFDGSKSWFPGRVSANVPAQWSGPANYAAVVDGRKDVIVVEALAPGADPNLGGNNCAADADPKVGMNGDLIGVVRATYSDGDGGGVAAPGTCIASTVGGLTNSGMHRDDGTSMAAPHVTGAAGLIAYLNDKFYPGKPLTAADLKQLIVNSARPIGAGSRGSSTKGELDVAAAIKALDGLHTGGKALTVATVDINRTRFTATDPASWHGDPKVTIVPMLDSSTNQYTFSTQVYDPSQSTLIHGDGVVDMKDFRAFRDGALLSSGQSFDWGAGAAGVNAGGTDPFSMNPWCDRNDDLVCDDASDVPGAYEAFSPASLVLAPEPTDDGDFVSGWTDDPDDGMSGELDTSLTEFVDGFTLGESDPKANLEGWTHSDLPALVHSADVWVFDPNGAATKALHASKILVQVTGLQPTSSSDPGAADPALTSTKALTQTLDPSKPETATLLVTTPLRSGAKIVWCPLCGSAKTCDLTATDGTVGTQTLNAGNDVLPGQQVPVALDATQSTGCGSFLRYGSLCHPPAAGETDACDPQYPCASSPSLCGGNQGAFVGANISDYGSVTYDCNDSSCETDPADSCQTAFDCHYDGIFGQQPVCVDDGTGSARGYCARWCTIGCDTANGYSCVDYGKNATADFPEEQVCVR
jgi:hypothetical protein